MHLVIFYSILSYMKLLHDVMLFRFFLNGHHIPLNRFSPHEWTKTTLIEIPKDRTKP